jgi:hypothetical protein
MRRLDWVPCVLIWWTAFRPSCSCVTLCFVSVDIIRGVTSQRTVRTEERMPIFTWKRMAYVCNYSSSRRDEVTLISLCPSGNSLSELITFLMLDKDVFYTEELELLPQVTCESCESRVSCCFWHPSRTGMERFVGGVCVLMGLRHMSWPYFEVMERLI